ncbi:hypothetical protein EJP82_01220 [Paenibacillus anaericanus]|uniref:Uncharacterized protein n=1 Tax=Paenibacillus anaericanus TaxID=170367 RepID=A0A3S1DTA6_9BACL|nr:hypothetical protein [Paenibacillus anaericanus]RUT48591.1 hypothetical protein EJP82_01220 [Paenibacillus anaericanus]
MAIIKNILAIEIEPTVLEVCTVISAAAAFYPHEEDKFLLGVQSAIDKRLSELEAERKKQRPKEG